jgi:hypothetical protein
MQYFNARGVSVSHPGYSPEKVLFGKNAIFLHKRRFSTTSRLQPWKSIVFIYVIFLYARGASVPHPGYSPEKVLFLFM